MSSGRIVPADLPHLERCLELAAQGRWRAAPNPLVGALIVHGGEVLGEGRHLEAGGPHAEVHAIASARDRGEDVRGATLYVNLEPCAHHGRTPPCVDAVAEAGIGRVVCLHRDPNPVAEGGAQRLRRDGIDVCFASPERPAEADLLRRAVTLNARFLVPIVRARPLVTLKWAMTLDGKIATRTGASQWISSPEGRDWALELRELHDAILVGSGTAIEDDPRLTRRLGHALGSITRVVMDRRLRSRPDAAMFGEDGAVLIYTESAAAEAQRARAMEALRQAGAVVVELADCSPEAVISDLGQRGIGSVLVEGGGVLLGSFVDAGLVDRLTVCCAPKMFGGRDAPGPVAGRGIAEIANAIQLGDRSVELRGPDVIVEGMETGCLRDLLSNVVGS